LSIIVIMDASSARITAARTCSRSTGRGGAAGAGIAGTPGTLTLESIGSWEAAFFSGLSIRGCTMLSSTLASNGFRTQPSGAGGLRAPFIVCRRRAGGEPHSCLRILPAGLHVLAYLVPGAAGQRDIRQDEIGREILQPQQGGLPIGNSRHLVPFIAKNTFAH